MIRKIREDPLAVVLGKDIACLIYYRCWRVYMADVNNQYRRMIDNVYSKDDAAGGVLLHNNKGKWALFNYRIITSRSIKPPDSINCIFGWNYKPQNSVIPLPRTYYYPPG